ncbi:MAG: 16S rRNA (guanine(527)-N(7))-methyltransferase RsmG [Solirubrobacteraceae bacterium]
MDIDAAVAGFVRRWALPAAAADRLQRLASLVSVDASAPTTVHEPTRILDDHLADSLVALELRDVVWHEAEIADLGAGPGFPGLPLAIALPGSRLSLVESNARKCQFLAGAVAECELDNVAVVRERAELWRDGLDGCDVVVARALAPLPVVAEYAAPLLRVGASLVAWRGRRDPAEEAAAGRAALQLGLESREPVAVKPYPEAEHRHLHVFVKVADTPARFPRRPGVAHKHPLGR